MKTKHLPVIQQGLNVGVTCVGSVVGQGIIRSLRKANFSDKIRIVGFDYFEDVAGASWVDEFHTLPDFLNPEISEQEYLDALTAHIAENRLALLFIGIGFELPVLSKAKEKIAADTGCVVVVSPPELIDTAMDKYKTYEFLKCNGLAHPHTWLPAEKDAVTYPAIVKPRRGTGSKGLSTVLDANQLEKALAETENSVIQELVGSKDDEYTCGVVYLDGEVKSTICLRRYLKAGNTNVAIHSPNLPDGLEEYVEKVAKAFKPFGPANLQIRIGDDGVPKLFEINPRFSGTTGTRSLFGVNEVEIVAGHLLGLPIPSRERVYGKVVKYLDEILLPQ